MIFISYREGDEPQAVRAMYKGLSKRLKDYKIYFDKNDIVGGTDFKTALAKQIYVSKIIVVPIGKHWLALLKERQEKERLNPKDWDSIDWLTWELDVALSASPKKIFIPVQLNSNSRVLEKDLPDKLKDLTRSSTHVIHQDNDELIEDGTEKLALAIKKHIDDIDGPSPSIWSKITDYVFRTEERLWSFATIVGNSFLGRYARLRPRGKFVEWLRNFPVDLILAVLPITLFLRYYLLADTAWSAKLGTLTGGISALLIALVVALITPYAPINLAVYLQNQDENFSRSIHRTLRGLVGLAIIFELPLMYVWIWKLNHDGSVRWFDEVQNFFMVK